MDEEKLKIYIDKLRNILNEMCYNVNDLEVSRERLIVSCQLDKLIVEYMNLKNKCKDSEKAN